MNYYVDTELIEDFIPRCFDLNTFSWESRKHYIDLISIGIVAEDGREYYAVNKEFDLKHVWNKYNWLNPTEFGGEPEKEYWLRENVLRPIYYDLLKRRSVYEKTYHYSLSEPFSYKSLKYLIRTYGKTKVQIAAEIQCFTAGGSYIYKKGAYETNMETIAQLNKDHPPIFYGYYCDYDWVVFCSLFGRMLDLPKGYPMYMRDLKQTMDELGLTKQWKEAHVPGDNEHHALADARWNKKLHDALKRGPQPVGFLK